MVSKRVASGCTVNLRIQINVSLRLYHQINSLSTITSLATMSSRPIRDPAVASIRLWRNSYVWRKFSYRQVSVYRDSNPSLIDFLTLTGNGKSYPHGVSRVARLKCGTSPIHALPCHLDPLFAFATRRSTMTIAFVATRLFFYVLFSLPFVTPVKAQADARCLSGWDWVRNWNGGIE